MIFLEILVSVVVLLTVATVGTLCLIRPREIVNREQRLYQKSKFFRLNPFLFRPWYASYLRAMGNLRLGDGSGKLATHFSVSKRKCFCHTTPKSAMEPTSKAGCATFLCRTGRSPQ
jgi:hypothetical protein